MLFLMHYSPFRVLLLLIHCAVCSHIAFAQIGGDYTLGVGGTYTQPLQLPVYIAYNFPPFDRVTSYTSYVQLGVSVLNFKEKLARKFNLRFGREAAWSEDFLVTVGYGRRYHLANRGTGTGFYVEVTADGGLESYRTTSTWVRHDGQFYVYKAARFIVYHTGVTAAVGVRLPITRRFTLNVTPFSVRAGLGYVSLPQVAGLQPIARIPAQKKNLLSTLSPVDRYTGWKGKLSFFNGPVLGVNFSLW